MATYYWVGGSGTWDNVTTANWAASSGGAGGAGVPNNADTALFDSNSGTAATVTVADTAVCLDATINKSDINLSLSGSPTFAGTLTLTAGTITLNTYTLTCLIFSSNFTTARTIAFGTGNITLTGNNATIWNMADVSTFTYTGTPTVNATYSGSTGGRTINHAGTAGGSEAKAISFNITAGTDIVAIGNSGFYKNLVFTGFAGSLSNVTRTIYGNLTLSTGMTVTGGTNATIFASSSGTQTITSNGITFDVPINIGSATAFPTVELADALNTGSRNIFVIAGTFDTKGYNVTCASFQTAPASAYTKAIKLNNSTVTLSGTLGFLFPNNFTFDAGTSSIVMTAVNPSFLAYYWSSITFYNVSFTSSAPTQLRLHFPPGTATFNNLSFTSAPATSYVILLTGNIKVNGTLTRPTGNSYVNRVSFYSYAGSTINATAISGTLTDVDFRGITVTGPTAPWTGTRLGDGGGNSGITGFEAPKTVYWSQAAGGNWSDTAWATSSGGTPAVANYPILGDTVIFDNAGLNTSATVTTDRSFAINNLDFSTRSNAMTFAVGSVSHVVNGNYAGSSAVTMTGNSNFLAGAWSGTSTFTSNGSTISIATLASCGPTGTLTFADNYTSTSQLQVISGSVNLNGKTFLCNQFATLYPVNCAVSLSGAVITTSGSLSAAINNGGYGYKTFTGACTFNMSSASAKSVNNGAMLNLSGFTFVNTGAGALTFSNIPIPGFTDGQYGIYGDIQTTVRPATINFGDTQTFQFNNFTISGTSGNLVTLQSSLAGTKATLIDTSGTNNLSFCSIQDIEATGGATWNAYYANGNLRQTNVTGFNWVYIGPFNVYTLGAAGFTEAIRIRGRINISVYGSFVGTVTLQRSMDAVTWTTVDTYTSPEERFGHEPELIYYRVGFPTGGYTSGTAYVRIGRESKAYY
jgi:hypothetical protein